MWCALINIYEDNNQVDDMTSTYDMWYTLINIYMKIITRLRLK
jgi:hypothetical protein